MGEFTKSHARLAEILRFIVAAFLGGLADFIFYSLSSLLVQTAGLKDTSVLCVAIATTCGFAACTIVNYVLSIRWVYQDYDRRKFNKHHKTHILIFVILSLIALFIGIGVMSIFKVTLLNGLNINIDTWMKVKIPPDYGFFESIGAWIVGVFHNPAFGWYFLAFVSKNIIAMVYNYITRKKILFKDKKRKSLE